MHRNPTTAAKPVSKCAWFTFQEQHYIYSEARKQFRANQHTTEPADLEKQVRSALQLRALLQLSSQFCMEAF